MTTDISWEKAAVSTPQQSKPLAFVRNERFKFVVGLVLLVGVVIYLIISGTANNIRYFITVDDLLSEPSYVGQTVRISGAVIGDSIQYDAANLKLDFTIANVPEETTDLAQTLHEAVLDTRARRLSVHLDNEVKPDLLQNEAQAILTGELGADGVFVAHELLLKCPSRYQDNVPLQTGV